MGTSTTSAAAVNIPLSKEKRRLVFLGLFCMQIGFYMMNFAPTIALPQLVEQMNAMENYAMCSVAYSFTQLISIPLIASLGDQLGRKKTGMVSLVLACVVLFATAFATAFPMFLLGYALCGFCAGCIMTAPFLIASDMVELHERSKYMGYLASVGGVSMLLSPFVAGLVVDSGHPGMVFFLPIPFLVLAFVFLLIFFPNKANPQKKAFDWVGLILLFCTVAPLIFFFNFAGKLMPWISLPSLLLVGTCVGMCFLLVKHSAKAAAPVISLHLLKRRYFLIPALFNFLFNAYSVLNATFLMLFVQKVMNSSALLSSTVTLPNAIAYLSLPLIAGPWISKDPRRFKVGFILEGILAGVCMLGVSLLKADSPIYLLYGLVFLGGCGFAFATTCTSPFAQRSLDPSTYGAGQGTLQFFSSGSVAFIGSLLGVIMSLSGEDIASGLSHSFLFGSVLCFAIAVIALVFIRQEDIAGKKEES